MSKKFDVVIGNPPYQEDIEGTRAKQIYPYFYSSAKKIANKYCLVTPARFLFGVGSTPKKWNLSMLDDNHLKVLYYNPNSSEVFTNTDIKGGVAILYRDNDSKLGPIGTFVRSKELSQILSKVEKDTFVPLSNIMHSNSSYTLTDAVYEDYPEFYSRIGKTGHNAVGSNVFDRFPELFMDSRKASKDIKIYGRQDHERIYKYINKKYITDNEILYGYKVFVPGANGIGEIGEALSNPVIGYPFTGHTQTFISIGNFNTKLEANSVLRYIKTKFARALLGILKVTQNAPSSVWKKVPMQDFTEDSDIDWSKSIAEIDQQLYKKYNLTKEEINFIETNVKEMD